jgi:tRNA (guanine-N7-)-methyltransferase
MYAQLLRKSGKLILKHDNPDFFQWSLEQLVAGSWQLNELSFDLHESDLSDDYKIMTTYETRWLGEGRKTHLVTASLPK